ncbi:hypothetical protein AB0O07_17535 [Streptomyces sp. NPDC093085]
MGHVFQHVSQLGGTYKGVTYKDRNTTTLAKGGTQYVLMLADRTRRISAR